MKELELERELEGRHVLVTGAAGFIGRKLCFELQQKGYFVHALLRSDIDGPWDDVIILDLRDSCALPSLLGIKIVFHLAAKAHALAETSQDVEEYFRVNTLVTEALLDACKVCDVQSFIYFSSVKAAGTGTGMMDESNLLEPDTPYGQSKRASEKLVLEGGCVPHPVVIRPSMVYGNTDKGNLPKMIQAIRSGKFPPLTEAHNRRSMVHVDDVVTAAILAAENPIASGEIYIVTDGKSYSTRQMYEWICESLHKSVPKWKLPTLILRLLAITGDVIGSLRGRRYIFDSDALDKLIGSACYSSAKVERELGFKARRNLREALPEISQYIGDLQ